MLTGQPAAFAIVALVASGEPLPSGHAVVLSERLARVQAVGIACILAVAA